MNTLSVDHRDPLFPRGPGLGLRAVALLAICGALIYFDFRTPKLEGVRQTLSWALSPVLWVAALPQAFGDASDYLTSRDQLAEENHQLRDRQLQLEAKLQKFEALEAENRRIRELLASSKNLNESVLIAEIIAANQDPYRHQITLNKGARDRVYRGQALLDATGVMGQIVQVNPTTAVALLITDPDHGIPVEINRTGLQTIALGVGDGQALRLPFLPGNADIRQATCWCRRRWEGVSRPGIRSRRSMRSSTTPANTLPRPSPIRPPSSIRVGRRCWSGARTTATTTKAW